MLRINLRVFYAMLGDLFLKQVKVCFSALDIMMNVCIDVEYLVQTAHYLQECTCFISLKS